MVTLDMNLGKFQLRSLKTRVTLFSLAIFVVGIWALLLYASVMLREDMQRQLGEEQFATVTLIAAQVNDDLNDRLKALEKVAEGITPALLENSAALQVYLDQSSVFQSMFNRGTFVTLVDGTAVTDFALTSGHRGKNYIEYSHIASALKTGKSTVGAAHFSNTDKVNPEFGISVPIRDVQGKTIGALVGVSKLSGFGFLSYIMESHYGKTGGYLLVSRKTRQIIAATNKARIMEAPPVKGFSPLIDRFIQGYEGYGVTINPLGVEVLQSAKSVPLADWYIAAQMPTKEAFAPIYDIQQRMLLAALFLTLLTGGLTWWMLRRQLTPMLETVKTLTTLSESGQHPQPLPINTQDEIGDLIVAFNRLLETLAQREDDLQDSEKKYRLLIETASEGIVVAQGSSLKFFNPIAMKLTGYSEQELFLLPFIELIHPDDRELMKNNFIRRLRGEAISNRYHIRILTKESVAKWVEMSGALIEWEGQPATLNFITDITERKEAEDALNQFKYTLDQTLDCIFMFRSDNFRFIYVNEGAINQVGYSQAELLQMTPLDIKPEFTFQRFQELVAPLINNTQASITFETIHRHKDGHDVPVEIFLQLVRNEGADARYMAIVRDITERKLADEAKRASEAHLSAFYGLDLVGLTITSPDKGWIRINDCLCKMLEYSEQELRSMTWVELTHPDDLAADLAQFTRLLANEIDGYSLEKRFISRNGKVVYTQLVVRCVRKENSDVDYVVAMVEDISERKRVEDALREQEEFFRLIADNGEDFIAVLDLEGRRRYNNLAYKKIFGDLEAIKGTDSFAEIHPDDRERIQKMFMDTVATGIGHRTEFRFVMANGSIRHMESCGGLIKNGQGESTCVVIVSHDITERKETEEKIHNLAFHDTLTGLPNRRLLEDRLNIVLASSKRSGLFGALMFLDLDNFKPLNDVHGHAVGDLLLIEVANRLKSCVREMDTVARFGGDEYVVMLAELDKDRAVSTPQVEVVAEKIRLSLSEPYLLAVSHEGQQHKIVEHHCTASIGVALFNGLEANQDDILRWADDAMYQAKYAGRNLIKFYDGKS